MLLYVYRDHKDHQGRGAPNDHVDFHTARSCESCALGREQLQRGTERDGGVGGEEEGVFPWMTEVWQRVQRACSQLR